MACEAPIEAYRPAIGGPLRFNQPKDGRAYSKINVPCGTCILCRTEQARQWAVRITHEATLWPISSFLTLTYNDANLPTHGSLRYEDLQKFWKRLRKEFGKLRYYAVGEYGDKTLRPHYHACVFGHAFATDRIMLRSSPTPLWTSPMLEKAWGLGNVSVGALTFATARYTASYITKKLRSKQKYVRVDEETGELVDLVQPRAFMSLRPAIGAEWLAQYGDQVYAHDRVVIEGQIGKPPKYYDRWLEKRSPIALQLIKEQREANAQPDTQEQTRARARIARAHAKAKSKSV